MAAEKIRTVTATATMTNTEDTIIFDSAAAIEFQLLPAKGDGRKFTLKNVGAGAVTLLPYDEDYIFDKANLTSKILY
jgi:hypothetical protein